MSARNCPAATVRRRSRAALVPYQLQSKCAACSAIIWPPSCRDARTRLARSCRSSAYAGSAATTRPAASAVKLEPPAEQSITVRLARSAGVRPNIAWYSAADLDEIITLAPVHDCGRPGWSLADRLGEGDAECAGRESRAVLGGRPASSAAAASRS